MQRRHDVEKVDGGELRHVVDRNVHVAVQALLHKGAVDVDILAHLNAKGAKGVFRREQREVPEEEKGLDGEERGQREEEILTFQQSPSCFNYLCPAKIVVRVAALEVRRACRLPWCFSIMAANSSGWTFAVATMASSFPN